jgi:L-lactate dehydrogenase complex protein LldG
MTSSRAEILARIRRARQRALLPDVTGITPPPPEPPPFDRPLIDVFEEALRAVQGVPHRCTTVEEVADLIAEQCRAQGQSEVLTWEALPLPGLAQALQAQGITRIPSRLTGSDRQRDFAGMEHILVGVTGAAAGLARTGSIVLHADVHHGRLASLLPDIHIALLPIDRIHPDIAAWIATDEAAERIMASSNTVIITGPSRTADIAQTLTLGAHGPRELHVILFGA